MLAYWKADFLQCYPKEIHHSNHCEFILNKIKKGEIRFKFSNRRAQKFKNQF